MKSCIFLQASEKLGIPGSSITVNASCKVNQPTPRPCTQWFEHNRRIIGQLTSIHITCWRHAETPAETPAILGMTRTSDHPDPSAIDQLFVDILTSGITTNTNELRRGLGEVALVTSGSDICDFRVSVYAGTYHQLNRLNTGVWKDEGRNLLNNLPVDISEVVQF